LFVGSFGQPRDDCFANRLLTGTTAGGVRWWWDLLIEGAHALADVRIRSWNEVLGLAQVFSDGSVACVRITL
jgi:hypothetical protein